MIFSERVTYNINMKQEDINYATRKFIGTHEAELSYNIERHDSNVPIKFTTFGNQAGANALRDVMKMLDEETQLKVMSMMMDRIVEETTEPKFNKF